jgi:hypothetical protein
MPQTALCYRDIDSGNAWSFDDLSMAAFENTLQTKALHLNSKPLKLHTCLVSCIFRGALRILVSLGFAGQDDSLGYCRLVHDSALLNDPTALRMMLSFIRQQQ